MTLPSKGEIIENYTSQFYIFLILFKARAKREI